mmetsp:Transcript_88277/g.252470  ORF Transcript_88277/g.252470 Transcript_88277/m.252470 type:complete len:302 (-) Transcript_88277:1060-1965(-)
MKSSTWLKVAAVVFVEVVEIVVPLSAVVVMTRSSTTSLTLSFPPFPLRSKAPLTAFTLALVSSPGSTRACMPRVGLSDGTAAARTARWALKLWPPTTTSQSEALAGAASSLVTAPATPPSLVPLPEIPTRPRSPKRLHQSSPRLVGSISIHGAFGAGGSCGGFGCTGVARSPLSLLSLPPIKESKNLRNGLLSRRALALRLCATYREMMSCSSSLSPVPASECYCRQGRATDLTFFGRSLGTPRPSRPPACPPPMDSPTSFPRRFRPRHQCAGPPSAPPAPLLCQRVQSARARAAAVPSRD